MDKTPLTTVITLLLATSSAQAQTIVNPSFEANDFTVYPGYVGGTNGSITGWTGNNSSHGLNPINGGSAPFANNGTVPAGSRVAFVQSSASEFSSLQTTITGLIPGATYRVGFRTNARSGTANPLLQVNLDGGEVLPTSLNYGLLSITAKSIPPVGGANPYHYAACEFTATAESHALVFYNVVLADSTLLLDDFSIVALELPDNPWRIDLWSNDLSTCLSPSTTLWAYQFNTTRLGNINGVTVIGAPDANPSAPGRFSISGIGNLYNSDVNDLTAQGGIGSARMAENFIFNGNPATITLRGLVPGQAYEALFFGVGFGADGPRTQTFASGQHQRVIAEDAFGADKGIRIDYGFAATGTTQVITITPQTVATFHLYGLALNSSVKFGLAGPSSLTLECPDTYTEQGAFIGAAGIAAGAFFSLALMDDGTVEAWGSNIDGNTAVPVDLDDVVAISADQHSLALKSDGTVVAWGRNDFGQANVPPGLNNVVAISAGGSHSLALKKDGTVVAWGDNDFSQLAVPQGLNNVVAISAGGAHSLALRGDGTLAAWGDDNSGQRTIPPNLPRIIAIAAGANHSLALKDDGTVITWGSNNFGEADIPNGLNNVVAIAAGAPNSIALQSDGTLVAWGSNPVNITNVVAISAGYQHGLALKSDGSIVAWGNNGNGQSTVPQDLYSVAGWVSGTLDLNTAGTYTLTYHLTTEPNSPTVTRTVVVQDSLPPQIILNGDNPIVLTTRNFTDPGATALDQCTGTLPVTVTGQVNTNFPGAYVLTYNAMDAAGNPATPVQRTVYVAMPPAVPGDTDGDNNVSDAEFNVVRTSLTNELATLNAAGYYTASQVQLLYPGFSLIQPISPGRFRLTLGVQKSTNLIHQAFTDFPFSAPGSTLLVNPQGKLEFEFPAIGNEAFFGIEGN